MKKLILIMGISTTLSGCFSLAPEPTNPIDEIEYKNCTTLNGTDTVSNPLVENHIITLNNNTKESELKMYSKEIEAFSSSGVKLSISLWDTTENSADVSKLFKEVEDLVLHYHKISDKRNLYDGITNINTINNDPTSTHTIDQELFDLLKLSLEYHDITLGKFNIAMSPVIEIWDAHKEDCRLNGNCETPTVQELEAQREFTDISNIILDEENLTITMSEGMSLDLGAVAKGYATELVSNIISEDYSSHIINGGSSSLKLMGGHPLEDNRDWTVGLKDPTSIFGNFETIALKDKAIGTSGDYEDNYIIEIEGENDMLCHHIIDSDTLRPEGYTRVVTVITEDSGLADIFSTALFSMPIEDGIALVESIPDMEAIWYDHDDKIHMTDGFDSYIHKT